MLLNLLILPHNATKSQIIEPLAIIHHMPNCNGLKKGKYLVNATLFLYLYAGIRFERIKIKNAIFATEKISKG